MIREKLLEFLKCPLCLAPLAARGEEHLVCLNADCRCQYGVIDGKIPNLLPDDAEELDAAAWKAAIDESGAKPAEAGAAPSRRRAKPKSKAKPPAA